MCMHVLVCVFHVVDVVHCCIHALRIADVDFMLLLFMFAVIHVVCFCVQECIITIVYPKLFSQPHKRVSILQATHYKPHTFPMDDDNAPPTTTKAKMDMHVAC